MTCAGGCGQVACSQNWIHANGGLVPPDDAGLCRAQSAFAPLARASEVNGLSVDVLASDQAGAFAWPDGHVFVTRGLTDLITDDDELRAALAHEIGHVIAHAIAPATVVGIGGGGSGDTGLDDEIRADAAAVNLLAKCGTGPDPMWRVLEILSRRGDLPGDARRQLERRIRVLRGACPPHRPYGETEIDGVPRNRNLSAR
jgi:Zn-dependent protease with chaperone function